MTDIIQKPLGLIIALHNKEDKKIALFYFKSMYSFMARLNIDGGVDGISPEELAKCNIEIIEEGIFQYPNMRMAYWFDFYTRNLYTWLKTPRIARYTVSHKIDPERATVSTFLVGKNRGYKIYLGTFATLVEAKEFEIKWYGEGVYKVVKNE